MADSMLIDDRSSGSLRSSLDSEWRLVSDRVMGGLSSGELAPARFMGRDCLRMRGAVTTANNGGFVQMALDLAGKGFDASAYTGVLLQVAGNGEHYNVHLRTSDLQLPWQSYRAGFVAEPQWHELRFPFIDFEAYRTGSGFRPDRLVRIGLVAIGREFNAELCVARTAFYSDDATTAE